MAYSISENGIISLIIDARHFGQQIMLTTHWRVFSISPGSTVDSAELFTAWKSYLDTLGELGHQYVGSLSEDVNNINYLFQLIHPNRFVKTQLSSAFDVGGVAEPSFPPNTAHAIVVRADSSGPHLRGTKHIGGVPLTYSEAGIVTATGLTQYLNLAAELSSDIELTVGADTVVLNPVIYQRANPTASATITNAAVGSATRVQRRRTVGLGT